MKKHLYIKKDRELTHYIKGLQSKGISTIAMDFEGEYNLHCYGEKLCLIQVFDGEQFVIIDPFDISTGELKNFLEDKSTTRIFFDASSDKTIAFKQYSITISNILDLMDMVQLLELEKKGLDSVLYSQLGLTVEKKKKFQRYNWTRRPVSPEALEYALGDVEHLFALKNTLLKKIVSKGLYENLLVSVLKSNGEIKISNIPGVKKKREYKQLKSFQKKRFDRFFDIREVCAKKMNRPPNDVISNKDLFAVANEPEKLNISLINNSIPGKVKRDLLNELLQSEAEKQ